jgi:hypothetical protein
MILPDELGAAPFSCPNCGKTLRFKSRTTRDRQQHARENPFAFNEEKYDEVKPADDDNDQSDPGKEDGDDVDERDQIIKTGSRSGRDETGVWLSGAVCWVVALWLFAAWAAVSLFSFSSNRDHPQMGLILSVAAGAIIITIFVYLVSPKPRCPKCKASLTLRCLRSELTDKSGGYATVTRYEKDETDPWRRNKSSWLQQVHVIRETYINYYGCSKCGHLCSTEVSQNTYEG